MAIFMGYTTFGCPFYMVYDAIDDVKEHFVTTKHYIQNIHFVTMTTTAACLHFSSSIQSSSIGILCYEFSGISK